MTVHYLKLNGIAIFFASVLAIAVSAAVQADPLKLRLSVESTPGAPTQHILASFRDALGDFQKISGQYYNIHFIDSSNSTKIGKRTDKMSGHHNERLKATPAF
jgi:hypothetical protein